MATHIAVDAMGGDLGVDVTVPAALKALHQSPQLKLTLVGDKSVIMNKLRQCSGRESFAGRLDFVHAEQVVGMDERPSVVLRSKLDSSMRVAIELIKDGVVDACVSAGNTGALMAIGRYVLKTFPGIDRPAISTAVPTLDGHCRLLDLGANVDCHSHHLLQFAVMGSVLAQAVDEVPLPRVGLLNIGEEQVKGNEQVKLAAQLLQEDSSLNFVGYVEADRLYEGVADVVVCDGFVGNVALKASEGVARLIRRRADEIFQRNGYTRLAGWLVGPILRRLYSQTDPGRYNGASFLGLQGTVVKSHGSSDVEGFYNALMLAQREVDERIPVRINDQLMAMAL